MEENKKTKKQKFLVDVFRTYAHCIEVEAEDEEDAENIAYEMARYGKIDLADFSLTDDIETQHCGYVDEEGERHYN